MVCIALCAATVWTGLIPIIERENLFSICKKMLCVACGKHLNHAHFCVPIYLMNNWL